MQCIIFELKMTKIIQRIIMFVYVNKVNSASKSTGLFLNPSKTKYIHIKPSANNSVHSSDGSQIEKVEDFIFLGSYTNCQHDIQCRKHRLGQQFTPLTKLGERPSADSPN